MYQVVLIDENGNADEYAAGDPTPGRGANEFETREAALEAIASLEANWSTLEGRPENGQRWGVRERRPN